jgi:hypothetical protein
MADWQVGDLAVCVKVGLWRGTQTGRVVNGPIHGVTYTVAWVGLTRAGNLGLELKEMETLRNLDGTPIPWQAKRFRKIRPDKREACEEEFVTLLNRTRVPSC